MFAVRKMSDVDLKNKRVFIREDLNVPIENGAITNDTRIRAALPTIQHALNQNAAVIILAHLGRPTEGQFEEKFSLAPIAKRLSELLKKPVRFQQNWLDGFAIQPGEIVLCENVRFNVGEKKDSDELSKKMAQLCDVFVMDAFGAAHRAHASTHGIAKYATVACAGPLMIAELEALEKSFAHPSRPLAAIVGGSKVSTKLEVLQSLLQQVDELIVGGGIANTLLAATGVNVGKSLYEKDCLDIARNLLAEAKKRDIKLPLPVDVVVAKEFAATAKAEIKSVNELADDDMILDIGPKTAQLIASDLQQAQTIIWNGPVGVFEMDSFAKGTEVIAHAIAKSDAFSIAGGGDTIAAIDKFGVTSNISYISTGGGAFLEFIEGKPFPTLEILRTRAE